MQKGYSLPALVIAISLIGVALVGYLSLTYKQSDQGDVQGVSNNTGNGFSIVINAPDIWDFTEYLCESRDECEKSLMSGEKYTTISGGTTADHELFIPYTEDWSKYSHIKVFMKPAWGSGQNKFEISKSPSYTDGNIKIFKENNNEVQVLLIPIKSISGQNLDSIATFSGK